MKRAIIFMLFIVAIVICHYYVDRGATLYIYKSQLHEYFVLGVISDYIISFLSAVIFLVYFYGLIQFLVMGYSKVNKKILHIANSIVITIYLKDLLKYIFARTRPTTFTNNNLSLISHNVYRFDWFHDGKAYASFPSGHAAFIFAFATSLWFIYPKWRWLGVVLAIILVLSQLAMSYHYISDLIAGAGFGIWVSYFYLKQYNLMPTKNKLTTK